MGDVLLEEVKVYATIGKTEKEDRVESSGLLPELSEWIDHCSTFRLHTVPDQDLTVHLRIVSGAATRIPITIWSPPAYRHAAGVERLVLGMVYGDFLVMVLYNLVRFITIRDLTYLYYTHFILTIGFSTFVWDGLALQYLWPRSPLWNNMSLSIADELAALFGIQFTRAYLIFSKQTPRLDVALKAMMAMALLVVVVSVCGVWRFALQLADVLSLVGPIALLTAGILCLRRKYRPARHYLIATTTVLVGIVVEVAAPWVPGLGGARGLWTEYGMYVGSIVMVALFSLGLADRYHFLVRVRERTEAEDRALRIFSYKDALTGV